MRWGQLSSQRNKVVSAENLGFILAVFKNIETLLQCIIKQLVVGGERLGLVIFIRSERVLKMIKRNGMEET